MSCVYRLCRIVMKSLQWTFTSRQLWLLTIDYVNWMFPNWNFGEFNISVQDITLSHIHNRRKSITFQWEWNDGDVLPHFLLMSLLVERNKIQISFSDFFMLVKSPLYILNGNATTSSQPNIARNNDTTKVKDSLPLSLHLISFLWINHHGER